MRSRMLAFTAALVLAGCGQPSQPDPRAACLAQGHQPDSEEFRVCMDADGVELATGPGSPYANVDEEED